MLSILNAVLTARVIFTAKTSLDVFSLRREQVWTFSVLGDRIYEMRCPFVAVGLNACFIVLPHWDNMSQTHMLTHPVACIKKLNNREKKKNYTDTRPTSYVSWCPLHREYHASRDHSHFYVYRVPSEPCGVWEK